jgi:hypothetical protein
MHLDNASGPDPNETDAFERELAALPLVLERSVFALDFRALEPATVTELELWEVSPQPPISTPTASDASASRRARGERIIRFGWMLSCIWRLLTGRVVSGRFRCLELERRGGAFGEITKPR